jgi:hypothetical protein
MTKDFKGEDSHISIAMPDGTTCRVYIPFQVYAGDDGGEIVRFGITSFTALAMSVEAHLNPTGQAAAVLKSNPSFPNQPRQTLTDLPHSPERTQLPHLDLSALRIH